MTAIVAPIKINVKTLFAKKTRSSIGELGPALYFFK